MSKHPTNEELKIKWTRDISKYLVGRKITKIDYMSQEEVDEFGWYSASVRIHLDNGFILVPSRDDEGNDAGAIFTNIEGLDVIPVI